MKVSRRNMILSLAIGTTGLALFKTDKGNQIQAQTSEALSIASAFNGQHPIKPLSFDPATLNGLSEKMIRSHWEKNYIGSVRALNTIELRLAALLKDKDTPAYVYGDLKREELLRTGSVILHEFYFDNLGGDGRAGGDIVNAVNQSFGSMESWENEFRLTAAALSGGSGWAIFSYNLQTDNLHNYWAWDHMHNATMGYPLLVLDMYEHSYHMDYVTDSTGYIDAFMNNVNWEKINDRYLRAKQSRSLIT